MNAKNQTKFRSIEKETIGVQLPIPIVDALRQSAAKRRRSLAYIVTVALCPVLGQDPASFGIETVASPEAA